MFERLAQEEVTSFISHGSGAWCFCGFLMPMSPEDTQMMTALVSQTLSQTLLQVMAAQTLPSTQADQQSSRERIDERRYRKMGTFSGTRLVVPVPQRNKELQ